MSGYDHLDKDALVRLLHRRDAGSNWAWCGSTKNSKPSLRRTRITSPLSWIKA